MIRMDSRWSNEIALHNCKKRYMHACPCVGACVCMLMIMPSYLCTYMHLCVPSSVCMYAYLCVSRRQYFFGWSIARFSIVFVLNHFAQRFYFITSRPPHRIGSAVRANHFFAYKHVTYGESTVLFVLSSSHVFRLSTHCLQPISIILASLIQRAQIHGYAYVHVYVYTHAHTHACVFPYIQTCNCACVYACVCTCVYVYMGLCIYVCVYACLSSYDGSIIGRINLGAPVDTSCSLLPSQNIQKSTADRHSRPWQLFLCLYISQSTAH